MFPEPLLARAQALVARCAARDLTIATAESCTGGLVSGLLTEIPGSSAVVERGFVTYSNAAKSDLLGVAPGLIAAHGAVSAEVAMAMTEGALRASPASLAVAITGIAGPGGGSAVKPVGLVWFGYGRRGQALCAAERRFGDLGRTPVRLAAVETAVQLLAELAK